ncbi:DNA-directed RNA polymerase subunit K [Metallosphaera sp. J1]|uniref:DNA-directed RNA polymerase subunit K n=1 Tax=Metallosphaera TaxID=41980 RepID=UPI001EE0C49C|nr:DNA-directed RNA polymerase subunit K [Metallosphaera javensis (ex Hofmann et al. 2022)]MCG3108877.1 DNA-directed RNA polymerase subunit K [Metallosphaera javensis (ex Hofmann et al. 2022)]BCS94190.1 MAG: DNA-directed RNA polymerase subunit K [Metallosphaera javensis (ex Sakai et al. 2022)]
MSQDEAPGINPLTQVYVGSWRDRLTSYERARIISARALQLAMGASPLIDVSSAGLEGASSLRIAEEEFRSNLLPISVRRRFPNGKVELISVMKLSSKKP